MATRMIEYQGVPYAVSILVRQDDSPGGFGFILFRSRTWSGMKQVDLDEEVQGFSDDDLLAMLRELRENRRGTGSALAG